MISKTAAEVYQTFLFFILFRKTSDRSLQNTDRHFYSLPVRSGAEREEWQRMKTIGSNAEAMFELQEVLVLVGVIHVVSRVAEAVVVSVLVLFGELIA